MRAGPQSRTGAHSHFRLNARLFGIEGRRRKPVKGRNDFPFLVGPRQLGFERGVFRQVFVPLSIARPFARDAPDHANEAICKADTVLIPMPLPVENSHESFPDEFFGFTTVGGAPYAINAVPCALLNAFGV